MMWGENGWYRNMFDLGTSSGRRLVEKLADRRTPTPVRQIVAPTLPNHVRVALACMLSNNGDRRAALAELDAVLRRDPSYVQARLMKGQIQAVLGETAAAIKTFEQALEIDPTSENAIESLTQLYAAANRSKEIVVLLRNQSVPLTEARWRKLGHALWSASEEARNSSVFADVEDGCPRFEDVEAEYRRDMDAATESRRDSPNDAQQIRPEIAVLQRQAEKWAVQLAAQHSVLGRQDTMMVLTDYQHSQGRMRVLALNLVRHKKTSLQPQFDPPREIPEDLLARFIMDGKVELVTGWYNSTLPDDCSDYVSDDHIKGFLAYGRRVLSDQARDHVKSILKDYEADSHSQARRVFDRLLPRGKYDFHDTMPALGNLKGVPLAGQRVAVVGEFDPYCESMCIANGAHVTSVRVKRAEGPATLLELAQLDEWLERKDTYDIIICNWLVECWGLGRHGEKIDPDGDVALLTQFQKRLAPGGTIATTLLLGRDRLIFNATRIYGSHRLRHLIGEQSGLSPVTLPDDIDLASRRAKRTSIRLVSR